MKQTELREKNSAHAGVPSWGLMLVLLFGAILVAMGIAWLMIAPYVHRLH
jgi:hypothetical protein